MPWEWFINAITGGDRQAAGLLQEFAGYCELADNRHGVLLALAGPLGECGTLISGLIELVGPGGAMQIGDGFMEEASERARLRNKHLVVSCDFVDIAASHWFLPALEGGLVVGCNGAGVVRFAPRCKFVFAAAKPGQFARLPHAVLSRLVMVQIHPLADPLSLCEEDAFRRDNLLEQRPAIRAWAAEGLERLIRRGSFPADALGAR